MVTRNLNLSEGWSERKGHLGQIELNNRKHTGGVASGIWYVIKKYYQERGVFDSINSLTGTPFIPFRCDDDDEFPLPLSWLAQWILPCLSWFLPSPHFRSLLPLPSLLSRPIHIRGSYLTFLILSSSLLFYHRWLTTNHILLIKLVIKVYSNKLCCLWLLCSLCFIYDRKWLDDWFLERGMRRWTTRLTREEKRLANLRNQPGNVFIIFPPRFLLCL